MPSLPDVAPAVSTSSRLPLVAVIGASAVLAVVAAALLLGDAEPTTDQSTAPVSVAATPAPVVAPVARRPLPTPDPVDVRPPDVRPLDLEADAANTTRPAQTGTAVSTGRPSDDGGATVTRPSSDSAPVTPGRVVYSDVPLNAPITAPRPRPASAAVETPASTARDRDLKLYSDFAINSRSGVPTLRLDVHVYSDDPANRFVFVNMRKYREGDRVDGDIVVDRITPDGAILSRRGERFLLPRS